MEVPQGEALWWVRREGFSNLGFGAQEGRKKSGCITFLSLMDTLEAWLPVCLPVGGVSPGRAFHVSLTASQPHTEVCPGEAEGERPWGCLPT